MKQKIRIRIYKERDKYMVFKKENKKSEYDIYLDKLLNLIRKKGILCRSI